MVVPGEVQYDAARICFNALIDRRPAVIVRCLGRGDVATAFDFARSNELEIAVRGGGHNPAGHCVLDGGLVIDLSRMRRVHVDRDVRIARAEGGSTWFDFDTATVAEGLGTPGGVVGSTGVLWPRARRWYRSPDVAAGSDVRQHRRRRARHARRELRTRERGREPGAAVGVKGRRRQLRRRDAPRVSIAPAAIGDRREAHLPRAGRGRASRFPGIVADAPRDASCQAVLVLDESLEPAVVVFPCVTGSENDHPLLVTLRARPGLVEDGYAGIRSSRSSPCSAPVTASTGITGRAISCGSCPTS